jgi:chromosome segregation protein
VHLHSLTLRGFKSFAEKTTLTFEPGITVIVGPNGSGKSNVVDALTWVLGASSAKSLRGGQMADVIFAGAPGKSALGRAQVEIAIDNSDGALPIEFSEVAVSRAIFASGENSYAINDVDCRALDVAELLSDTGLGRENHTIVGQGRLDAVLNARPEDRRAFIEEAAGILKHRKRKERALRKIAQMEAHVERLTDLLRELRRNLRPLERQAEAAQKHAELQRTLREVRVLRALRELDAVDRRWVAETSAQADSDARLGQLETVVATAREHEAVVERELSQLTPAVRTATETHFRLANLVERYRGLTERIAERRTGLQDAVEEPVAGRDPAELRARAAQERRAMAELDEEDAAARSALEGAEDERRMAEQARRAHEQAAAVEARRRAQAREQQLRRDGEVAALRSSLAQAASEEGRLGGQVSGLEARRGELGGDVEAVTAEIEGLESGRDELARRAARAEEAVAARQSSADAAARDERTLERRRASLEARADALRAASQEAAEGASALLIAADEGAVDGIVGRLAERVRVAEGMAGAVAAALGPLGEALVVESRASAEAAVGFVCEQGSGRVLLLPIGPPDAGPGSSRVADASSASIAVATSRDRELADLGAQPLLGGLRADDLVLAALAGALDGMYVTEDFATAARLAERFPDRAFVSADGEIAGPRGYAGGSAGSGGAVLSRAAAEQAEVELAAVDRELVVARCRLSEAEEELQAARSALQVATAALQEADGRITSASDRRTRLRKELATAERELGILVGLSEDLARELEGQRERLAALEERGATDSVAEEERDGPDLEAERLDDVLAEAREREVQARLAAGVVQQRGQELARRVDALEREADAVERQLAERERRRSERLAAIERCAVLAEVAAQALARTEASLAAAERERDEAEEARGARQRDLGVVRARLREAIEQLGGLRDARHAEDLRRAELRHALDAVRRRMVDELGIADPEAALATAREAAAAPAPADREAAVGAFAGGVERDAELGEEEDRLVKKLGLLGTVNPLALEEFSALQERHRFLSEQLDDLRSSRADLLEVIGAVDVRIREVFADAYADVAAHFERIFPRLFPGGDGRLVLTDPDDMLHTGIEVEARPAGKRVKRLSLLSGGERSLTALAVLFAIFAARPSPFYVLDEVEAALDDVNLQRFLDVVKDFRHSSQLIIVSHQKRTMEIADVLYGISMQGNGVSRVISQRMDERAPV